MIAGQLETKDRGRQDAIDDNPISNRVSGAVGVMRPIELEAGIVGRVEGDLTTKKG